jgi:CTP:molybdopterin cytidylyltransferase MocA
MLVRVLDVLAGIAGVGRIAVSVDDPAVLDAARPGWEASVAAPEIAVHQSKESPAASVLDYLQNVARGEPVLVTTADHPLLTAQMVHHFWERATASGADVAVGMARASVVLERYPGALRSFIPLRDDRYTATNLFAFLTRDAAAAAAFWRRMEAHRKRPWRLIAQFGAVNLALILLRRLDLDAAVGRASRVIGARVVAVEMPFPDAAIDVDKPSDLELATDILARRTA